jgi:hypothetical protein
MSWIEPPPSASSFVVAMYAPTARAALAMTGSGRRWTTAPVVTSHASIAAAPPPAAASATAPSWSSHAPRRDADRPASASTTPSATWSRSRSTGCVSTIWLPDTDSVGAAGHWLSVMVVATLRQRA